MPHQKSMLETGASTGQRDIGDSKAPVASTLPSIECGCLCFLERLRAPFFRWNTQLNATQGQY